MPVGLAVRAGGSANGERRSWVRLAFPISNPVSFLAVHLQARSQVPPGIGRLWDLKVTASQEGTSEKDAGNDSAVNVVDSQREVREFGASKRRTYLPSSSSSALASFKSAVSKPSVNQL